MRRKIIVYVPAVCVCVCGQNICPPGTRHIFHVCVLHSSSVQPAAAICLGFILLYATTFTQASTFPSLLHHPQRNMPTSVLVGGSCKGKKETGGTPCWKGREGTVFSSSSLARALQPECYFYCCTSIVHLSYTRVNDMASAVLFPPACCRVNAPRVPENY